MIIIYVADVVAAVVAAVAAAVTAAVDARHPRDDGGGGGSGDTLRASLRVVVAFRLQQQTIIVTMMRIIAIKQTCKTRIPSCEASSKLFNKTITSMQAKRRTETRNNDAIQNTQCAINFCQTKNAKSSAFNIFNNQQVFGCGFAATSTWTSS